MTVHPKKMEANPAGSLQFHFLILNIPVLPPVGQEEGRIQICETFVITGFSSPSKFCEEKAHPIRLSGEEEMDQSQDETRLMAKAGTGSREAFDTLVRAHQEWIQRFATRMLGGDSAEGSAVAVEAFVKLWQNRASVTGNVRPWLARAAYRLCLDVLRGRRLDCPDPDCITPAFQPEKLALEEAVRRAVCELPESQRAVLILSVYEQMSYEEISAALSVPVGTVGSRKNLAIAELRRRLAGWEDPR
jgi:RNA polymerase sigma-70 factor, ECF subfamily